MTINKKISEWFRSGEYKVDLSNALTNIIRDSENSDSEQSTSSIFETEIYFLIRERLGIKLNFNKEVNVENIIHTFGSLQNRTSGKGRLDAVVNNLIIEYKHFSKLKTKKQKETAYQQVTDYLKAIYNNNKEEYSAILTDGINIAYFSFIDGEVKHTSLRTIKVDDLDNIIHAIINNNLKKFEPKNIIKDFSISPNSNSVSKDIALILFDSLENKCTPKTQMLYTEWKSLMHLSINDDGKSQDIDKRRFDLGLIFGKSIYDNDTEYKALFALQTSYAIIVKLIACKVVDTINYSQFATVYHELLNLSSKRLQNFFSRMEEGYSYHNMNILNFLEGDFFSWYSDINQWTDELYSKMKLLLEEIDEYSSFTIDVNYNPIDIFKDLYINIIPQSVRHSMGEYFTPEWLADSVTTEALSMIDNYNWKAIDPCCGSGIFVISLIKKIVGSISILDYSKEQKEALLKKIIGRVYGIDINPLSVLSARVSYYLAIHQLGTIENVEIPIYLGDSAIVPKTVDIDTIPCYEYSVSNNFCESIEVILPVRFVQQDSFGSIMSKLQALVKTDDSNVLFQTIEQSLDNNEKRSKHLIEHIKNLAKQLVYLHKNNWDGIWIRISTNFMLIARLSKFDLIIGNPPWVKWEHLPTAYANKIKEFCDIRHIFCNDGLYGGAQLNVCALIANVTATNWLSNKGVLAFLMPDSIMSQNSYEEFRNFYINYDNKERLYLQKIYRWMAPLRPFKVGKKSVTQDFNTYFYSRKRVNYNKGIDVIEVYKKPRISDTTVNDSRSWFTAKKYLTLKQGKAKQLSNTSTAFTYMSEAFDFSIIIGETAYNYRTGVESTPFEVFKLKGYKKSNQVGHYRFKNDIRKTARYKVEDIPLEGWDFPTRYIYPMVQAPQLSPFKFNINNSFHIIPYEEDNTSTPITLSEMSITCPELATYFADHNELIAQQSKKSKVMHRGEAFYALSKIGPYTFADNIVAARDNTKFCASIIKPTMTPWGEIKKSVCVKHTIIISQDDDGNFISENEAYYINGVLNSDIVVAYIESTFKSNGFSLKKSHLFLPKYDENNKLFRDIVKLSKLATIEANGENNKDKINDFIHKLGLAYINLCKAYNKK